MGRFRKGLSLSFLMNRSLMLDFELNPIRAFVEESAIMIERKSKKLKEELNELEVQIKKNPKKYFDPEEGELIAFDYFESDFMNLSNFSPLLFNSTFILLYSKLETKLFDICNDCQLHFDFKISAKDISERNYIQKCKKYLEKLIGVDFYAIEYLWDDIKYYQNIRNIIVHENGSKEIKNTELLKFIANNEGIYYDNDKLELSITKKQFVLSFISFFEKLIDKLIHEIVIQKSDST